MSEIVKIFRPSLEAFKTITNLSTAREINIAGREYIACIDTTQPYPPEADMPFIKFTDEVIGSDLHADNYGTYLVLSEECSIRKDLLPWQCEVGKWTVIFYPEVIRKAYGK